MSTVIFYPLGNADSTLIKLDSGKFILFDFGNEGDPSDKTDKRIDLKKAVRDDIGWPEQKEIDVVAFTHGDNDHVAGASEIFWLNYSTTYQDEDRIKIKELWVPAHMIVETNVDGDNYIIRQEARHRLKEGKGIRVFSRPEALSGWLAENGLTIEERGHLITNAGKVTPGWTLDADGIEFFVHSPFAHRHDAGIEDRNQNCLVMQAVFRQEGDDDRRMLITADSNMEDWNLMVDITKAHAEKDAAKKDRLKWDIFKCPHHCSYTAMSDEKGETKTKPSGQFEFLLSEGSKKSVMVSSSVVIPTTDEKQPPHFQTYNRYKETADLLEADLRVTMEHPSALWPGRMIVKIDRNGVMLQKESIAAAVSITSQTSPRMG
ncbi:MAG: hypothetical protein QOE70_938 [Chthoniobacter sp.]|jgi:hypothetical protein|nr:hypothetical protein [Chthoniobacter sp.]